MLKLLMAAACSLQLPPIVLQALYDTADFHGMIKLKARRIADDSCAMATYPSVNFLPFGLNLSIRVVPQTETLNKCIFVPVCCVAVDQRQKLIGGETHFSTFASQSRTGTI
jgi:hypothetical protein